MTVTRYGAPLEPRELPPPSLRPGCALLEVLTCGVCFSDVKIVRGRMPFSAGLPLPHVPGHEICARVLETDPPGALNSGTLVVVHNVWPCATCAACRSGRENICPNPRARLGFTEPGGFQERIVAPLERLAVVPAGIDCVHAAPLTCALGTAYRAVVTRGGAVPGARMAVIGLGGVGIHALQIAAACGAQATGMDTSPRTVEFAAELGLTAHDVRGERLEGRLPDAAGGERFDVVIDTVGQRGTILQALDLVRPGGRIVAVGYSVSECFLMSSSKVVLEEIELAGSRYVLLDELERVIRLVAEGRVQVVVDEVLDLSEADAALARLEAGEVIGRLVIDVAAA
jgi:D-arabinose 1-dehydrogenase-like Zn-dependent alcohol dehydrogenase